MSVIVEHPCCLTVNLLLVVTDLRDTLCPNVEIQKRYLWGECVEKSVQKPSSFNRLTDEFADPVPFCELGHKLQGWNMLRIGQLESRGILIRTAVETFADSLNICIVQNYL